MSRRTILTLNDVSYLIPEDQTTDLRKLLEDIAAWKTVAHSRYGSGPWTVQVEATTKLGLNFIEEDDIDDGKPKAAAPEPEEAEAPL